MRLCVVVGLASLATRWALVAHGAGIDVAYQVTVCRLEGLVAGAFLAAAARGDGGLAAWRRPAWGLAIAAGAGLAAIGLAHGNVLPDDPLMQRFGYSLLALFYGGLLVLVLLNPSPLARRLFEARPMRFFGKYSYGLYVIHHLWLPMAYAWTTPLAQRSYLLSVVVRLALGVTVSTVLAIGSWHLVERPFLTLKRRFEYGRKPARIRVAEPSVADVPSLVATP
jgi:peptidoglycan/LPS O-acetylase OafA/YrhL